MLDEDLRELPRLATPHLARCGLQAVDRNALDLQQRREIVARSGGMRRRLGQGAAGFAPLARLGGQLLGEPDRPGGERAGG